MNPVNPSGPTSSKVMIVTDFPETGDLVRGKIFTSKQGYLFGKILEDGGAKLNGMYTTATCFHVLFPDKKTVKNKKLFTKFIGEHSRSREEMNAEISLIQPNVILSVGEWPLQHLTGNNDIKRFQGSILNLHPQFSNKEHIKVIPVQHPRDIYKVYSAFYYTPVYIKRALRFKDDPRPFKEKIHIEIARNFQTLKNYVTSRKNSPYLVSDIETYYNLISCIGVSLDEESAVVVPLLEGDITHMELCEMLKFLQKSYNYFPFVNQNAVFDQIRLERYGFRIKTVLGDTMLNMGVLYPELPKNLGFINSMFTDIPYFKDEGKGYTPCDQLYRYCGKDCISTYRIYKEQMKEADEVGVKTFITNRVMKYYPVYRDMQLRGIQVDGKIRDELIENYEIQKTSYTGDIKSLLGFNLNPLSPKQCDDLLYKYLKLPIQKKRRASGDYTNTADEDAIDFLILNHVDDPRVQDLLQKIVYVRKIEKILGYLNIPLHPGDVFHSSFNVSGTETGRTSTSKSGDNYYTYDETKGFDKTELGYAFQTIPKHGFELANGTRIGADIRKMFVPRDGYVFCEGDQSKAEAVIVTVLAQDWDLYSKFYDVNLHKITAMDVFGFKDISAVGVDEYNIGKRVRHAANYDMKEDTLAKQALIPVSKARQVLTAFHKKNWKIRDIFHRNVADFVTRNLWLNTPYGRRRDFFVNPRGGSSNFLREAYAYIPQSTVAEKTKIGMVESGEIMKAKKIDKHFLGESHDSVLSEVKVGQEHEYFSILKERMEQPIDMRHFCIPRDVDCVIKFECSIGENWKDLKEVKI